MGNGWVRRQGRGCVRGLRGMVVVEKEECEGVGGGGEGCCVSG